MRNKRGLVTKSNLGLLICALVCFVLKWILGRYPLPGWSEPVTEALKLGFALLLSLAVLYLLSFILLVLIMKKASRVGAWLTQFFMGLKYSIPVVLYGSIIYMAAFQSWKNIFIFGFFTFAISIIDYVAPPRKRSL